MTGVAVGASPSAAPFATFENSAGAGSTVLPLPTISTLSAAGTNKAFLSADGAEIGSPDGAAPPDRTPPTITFLGNAGTYDVADTVAITCTAADAGVGLASSTCAEINAPAWTFGPGSHTITASATDLASNTAHASVIFKVTATADSLEKVTLSLLAGAPASLVQSTTAKVDAALKNLDKLPAGGTAAHLKNYAVALDDLVNASQITAEQATTLKNFAATL